MARAKLLRQYLEDYNRKVAGANKEYQQRYDAYKGQLDNFNALAETFNRAGANPTQFFYGSNQVATDQDPYAQYVQGMYIEDGENPGIYQANYYGSKGAGQLDASRYQAVNRSLTSSESLALLSRAGVTDQKLLDAVGSGLIRYVEGGENYYWKQDSKYGGYRTDPGGDSWGGIDLTEGMTPEQKELFKYQAVLAAPNNQPAEPAPAEEFRPPNLTQGDIRELKNPSQDMAGLQMMMNKGLIGKSELADNEKSKVSAFADPEDPNNLKDAGILARVMGGQL
jgi:hypothetical protein